MRDWFLKLFPNLIKQNVIVEMILEEVAAQIHKYNKQINKKLNTDI